MTVAAHDPIRACCNRAGKNRIVIRVGSNRDVDHSRLDERLGGEDGYARLTDKLKTLGIGQIADIVPNHMALAGRANAWWWDVLENGPASRYATSSRSASPCSSARYAG